MRRCHSLKSISAGVLLALASATVSANPLDPTVVSGQASFASAGNTLTVTNTPGTIINWQGFSIGAKEITRFAQQSASSTVLNRVISSNPSSILGTLQSNGRVFLINPNGIVFGAGSVVDVAGLVASTLNLSDADFLAGRNSFTEVPGAASVSNAGDISAQDGGQIFLIAPDVENTGVITAPNGEILLAAGHSVDLVSTSDPNLRVNITAPAGDATNVGQLIASSGSLGLFGAVVRNSGTVSADSATLQGGKIVFKASLRAEIGGTVSANGTSGGSVDISAAHSLDPNAPGVVIHTGSVQANGAAGAGGSVSIGADSILSTAAINADGTTAGGLINVLATNRALSTASAQYTANSTQGQGGDILVSANVSNYTSGSYSATGMTGGNLTLAGSEIKLAGAQLDASGMNDGGTIHVGGLMHGAAGFSAQGFALANATNILVNSATSLKADGGVGGAGIGNGGEIVLWSDQAMRFTGNISAKGGALGGNGGMAEVSGLTSLGFGGLADLSAVSGLNGTLLLDPRNITIVAGGGATSFKEILDPTPGAGEGFGGFQNLELSNGNIVIASPLDSLSGANSGAVYLYDPTGALLSALVGTAAGDKVGGVTYNENSVLVDHGGLLELGNGNVVVASNNWSGTFGAVSWMNGTTGALSDGSIGGVVTATNSLVGSQAGDKIGTFTTGIYDMPGISVLASNNVAIHSSNWGGAGVAANALGAVTWMSGATGKLSNNLNGGAVTSGNSLVGAVAGDKVGTNTFTGVDQSGLLVLNNGNLLVESNNWGGTFGAVTWVDGATGALSNAATGGVISTANSLIGTVAGEKVGSDVRQLATNNAVVVTPNWSNGGAIADAGAVTWMSGTTGKLSDLSNGGVISAANSLVGSLAGDKIGTNTYFPGPYDWTGLTLLDNGNLLIGSNNWNSARGAATWMNGTSGVLSDGTTGGAVSATNSLVGTTFGDRVGSEKALLTNGNVVISSKAWNNGGTAPNAGAMTWMNGANGRFSDGSTGGAISVSNSLVGSSTGDKVGTSTDSFGTDYNSYSSLGNGNLLISSTNWNGTRGAVTWMNGTTGALSDGLTGGAVSVQNSLLGSTAGDKVGSYEVFGSFNVLGNNNAVVITSNWTQPAGGFANAGAVTWINGASGKLSDLSNGGVISGTNSLIGNAVGDRIGSSGITSVSNTPMTFLNYLVNSPEWGSAGVASAGLGAVTWVSGATGLLSDGVSAGGAVSAANSLVGSTTGDRAGMGNGTVILSNGNLLIRSGNWNAAAGAATWMKGATGEFSNSTVAVPVYGGAISAANSLIGSTAADTVGAHVTQLGNDNLVIVSPYWDNAAATDAGAVTWMSGATGALSDASTGGVITGVNSLIGSTANDRVGYDAYNFVGVSQVTNGTFWNYVVRSSGWAGNTGAITWVSGATGKTSDGLGVISATNSVVGSTAGDNVGFNGGLANSILMLGNGNIVFASSSWNGGMGAVTWMNGATGQLSDSSQGGVVSNANSLVGSISGDQIGYGGMTQVTDYSTFWNYAVQSPYWTNGTAGGAGAVTLGAGATGTVGVVTASNSLVGSAIGDGVGSGGITLIDNGNFVVSSPDWGSGGIFYSGLGAVTWVNGQTGALSTGTTGGVVGSANSLTGSTAGDQVGVASSGFNGLGGVNVRGNGNLLIRSQQWGGGVSALSWMNGTTGKLAGGANGGAVSASNSLLGSAIYDDLGNGQIGLTELLVNGNWVITSPDWGGVGAATWMNNATGQLADGSYGGVVSATNSLVGTATTPGWIDAFCDCFGSGGVLALTDGNYVAYWQNDTPVNTSVLVWGNGTGGTVGTVASNNSLSMSSLFVAEMSNQPGKVLVGSGTANGGAGGVFLLGGASSLVNSSLYFADNPGVDAAVGADWISSTLSTGTGVELQANNDIIQSVGAVIDATGSGNLTLQAGRSVILNDDITIGGVLNITANDPNAIAAAGGGVLDTSLAILKAGQVILNNFAGDVSIGTIIGGIGDVTVAATGGNFINSSGSATPISTTGKISIYSTSPAADTLNGMGSNYHLYNCTYAAGCLTAFTVDPGVGTGMYYSLAPTLTITANAASKVYGSADPAYTHVVTTGLVGEDLANTPGVLSGALGRTIATGESVAGGPYAIDQGTLYSPMGYAITTFNSADLTITPAPLTVSANAASKILNTADPLLTYTVSGLQFTDTASATGSISRVPGETVGTYQINQGTLALSLALVGPGGNYYMSNYVSANFTILVPTVIDEIVNTSLLFGPDTGSAQSTSSSEKDKATEDILADADTKPVDGTTAQPLPMCN